MISQEFEPKYGIKVNVNILPSGNTTVVNGASPLLLSVVAGNTPDIALGCDSKTPIELAIRGQLVSLSQFSDFEEVSERFAQTSIDTLSYEDECYALPETMEMPIMVYRTDILEQNGIEVPQTWEELWRYTLPQLAQIDGNFYIGSSDVNMYASFLYQNGGEFYNSNGDCMLNSDEAILAFDQWTKCFVQYNMPQSASFYNEMRTGTIPIGICTLEDYMQLLTYAGELTGKLGVAEIPGVEQDDGSIARYSAGDLTSAVIFNNSEKKEACWTFLKWWTSEDVQSRYASEIETRVGATGRWFSANKEAFFGLSWNNQDRKVLQNWLKWYKNVPNVLGGYYSSRSITNAWTRTVMSGTESRDSIEQSYEEIANQIERKRQEYDVDN
jgi:ABC-type glycerol-3-phosphate transport system substrate-binding protein